MPLAQSSARPRDRAVERHAPRAELRRPDPRHFLQFNRSRNSAARLGTPAPQHLILRCSISSSNTLPTRRSAVTKISRRDFVGAAVAAAAFARAADVFAAP